jgi:hypothetical protein
MAKGLPIVFETQCIHKLRDTEVMLTIYGDLGRETFQMWWEEEGEDLFNEWVQSEPEPE